MDGTQPKSQGVASHDDASADKPLSNRKIAKTLNVDEGTVRNDVRAENSAPGSKKGKQNKGGKNTSAENSAPALTEGEDAAKVVAKRAARRLKG